MIAFYAVKVIAALDLIPDAWQTGPLNEIIMLGAVLAALGVMGRFLIVPLWRWIVRIAVGIETIVERISAVADHEDRIGEIDSAIKEIHEALRPTNGDRRSISDRLDTVKQQTLSNADEIRSLRSQIILISKEGNPS
jgi:hypothetical protein